MKVVVKQTPDNEIPVEILARSIVDIGDAMKRINNSMMNRHALILLVAHNSGCAQRDVKAVLNSLDNLALAYLKPKKK